MSISELPIHDYLRTLIIGVGAAVALMQMHIDLKIKGAELLSQLNERLSKFRSLYPIVRDGRSFASLTDDEKHEVMYFAATFEDIAVFRKQGLISRDAFLRHFGARYRAFRASPAFSGFVREGGLPPDSFRDLDTLDEDVKAGRGA